MALKFSSINIKLCKWIKFNVCYYFLYNVFYTFMSILKRKGPRDFKSRGPLYDVTMQETVVSTKSITSSFSRSLWLMTKWS